MLTTSGTLRCSATCAMAAVGPESNAPTRTCAPSSISFSARDRATSTLDSMSAFISSMSTPDMSRSIPGAMSAPRWHDWPMKASAPERGSSTPTFSLFDWARTIAGKDSAAGPATADVAARRLKSRRVTRDMVSTSRERQGCDAAELPPRDRRHVRKRAGDAVPKRVRLSCRARLVPQNSFQDFPGGALGQLADDVDPRRHLVGRDVLAAVRDHVLRRQATCLPGHDRGGDLLALFRMRQAVHRHLLDLRYLVEILLDLRRPDLEAGHVDHVLHTVDDVHIAVVVHPAHVARVQPATAQGPVGLLRTVPVALHHPRPADADLAPLPARQLAVVLVEDGQLEALDRATHRTEAMLDAIVVAGERRAFRESVALVHAPAEALE